MNPSEQEDFGFIHGEPEDTLERFVELGRDIFGAPIVVISFFDEQHQWFKAKCGLPFDVLCQKESLCLETLSQEGIVVIHDTQKNSSYNDHPMVWQEPHIRFYAGVPLRLEDQTKIGTFFIADRRPRSFSPKYGELLINMGKQIEDFLVGKKALRDFALVENDRAQIIQHIVHDLKNPLTVIQGSLSVIDKRGGINDSCQLLLKRCLNTTERIHHLVEELLSVYMKKVGEDLILAEEVYIEDFVANVSQNLKPLCRSGQRISYHGEAFSFVTDKNILGRVIENLVSNSLKYGEGSDVFVTGKIENEHVFISVSDEGPGVPDFLKRKIFQLGFKRENSFLAGHGIGLHFCQNGCDLLKGDIWVEDNDPRGARFCLQLPLDIYKTEKKDQNRELVSDS